MFEIKPARESDAAVLAEFSEKTFVETFAKDNRPEDMQDYVSKTFGPEKQLAEIRDPRRRIFIAWKNGTPAGLVNLLDGEPDPAVQGAKPIEILRFYVSPEWHGKGLAPILMNRCLEEAAALGRETVWLGVWEKNFRAQSFYKKYGFEVCGAHIFQLGQDPQNDLIMVRSIKGAKDL